MSQSERNHRRKTFRDFGLISDDHCYIIAEAGINHNGSLELAKELVRIAHAKGADCVKFQKRTLSRILTQDGLDQPYHSEHSFGTTYGAHKAVLEFSHDEFRELFRYATHDVGIPMTASGWDEPSIDFLCSLPVPFLKMASADLTNFPLLQHAAQKGLPLVLSTGMADLDIVQRAYAVVSRYNAQVAILQCTSAYPAQPCDLHLNVISTFQQVFPDAVIGYSGHEIGVSTTVAAVALGARVIERHFTTDRTLKGGDHAASLEPGGLEKVCMSIRTCEQAFGSFDKVKLPCEEACFVKLTKSVVSAVPVPAGTILTREMLTTKGPGTGISPMDLDQVIGSVALTDIPEDVVLQWKTHVEPKPPHSVICNT